MTTASLLTLVTRCWRATPSERGVQFVTWEWDFDRKGVHHGHYFQDDYDAAKRDFTVRGRLVQKDALFEPEQLAEIYRALGVRP